MAKQRTASPSRTMKPVFLIFCEGETEEAYLDYLKQAYRSPIRIVPKIEGDSISQRLIDVRKKELKISKTDKILVFLMYDMDVPVVNERIKDCRAYKLLSNPAIEFWFLLHGKDWRTKISTAEAYSELLKIDDCWAGYEKAALTDTQKAFLWKNRIEATERARRLKKLDNPSSGIFNLILTMAIRQFFCLRFPNRQFECETISLAGI